MTSKAPRSPVSETEPVSGTPEQRERDAWIRALHDAMHERHGDPGCIACSDIGPLAIVAVDHFEATLAAKDAKCDAAEAAWQRESDARDQDHADYSAALAERDATIETLTAQRDAANDEANRLRYDLNHPYGEVARSAPDEDVKP